MVSAQVTCWQFLPEEFKGIGENTARKTDRRKLVETLNVRLRN